MISALRYVGIGLLTGLLLFTLQLGAALGAYRYARSQEEKFHPTPNQFAEIVRSSVRIVEYDAKYTVIGYGSGVIISASDDETLILTCEHVVDGAVYYSVTTNRNLHEYFVSVHKRSRDLNNDWAILRAPYRIGVAAPIIANDKESHLELGQYVASVGYGMGLENITVTDGRFQSYEGGYLRYSAPSIFGNSGGGVYAFVHGRLTLVGISARIMVSQYGVVTHLGFAVPIQAIRAKGGI